MRAMWIILLLIFLVYCGLTGKSESRPQSSAAPTATLSDPNNQTISTSSQESSPIESNELPSGYSVAEPIRVIRGIGEGCPVENETIEKLAVWLSLQFTPGESLDSITKKMKSRGRLLETVTWGGTGTQDANFVTDQGLIVNYVIDRFDHLLPTEIIIRCGARIGSEGEPQPIQEWTPIPHSLK